MEQESLWISSWAGAQGANVGSGSGPAAPFHPLCAPLQFAGDSSDLETSSLEDPAESPALAAADARGTTLVPRLRRSRAARGHMVVTGK